MTYTEFRRWLMAQGVAITEGSKHSKLRHGDKASTLPRHKGDIGEGLRRAIIKQLGIEETAP